MDRQTGKILAAIATALADERYTLRTAAGIARAAGVTEEEVLHVASDYGYAVRRRGSDGAALVGPGAEDDRDTNAVVKALFTALSDERYTLRTVAGIARAAEVGQDQVVSVAEDFNLVVKHRRSDGAALVGLA